MSLYVVRSLSEGLDVESTRIVPQNGEFRRPYPKTADTHGDPELRGIRECSSHRKNEPDDYFLQ